MSHLRRGRAVMRAGLLTSQVHPGLETLPYTTRRTVFPPDLVDDAVVPPRTQVVVLTYRETRRGVRTAVVFF